MFCSVRTCPQTCVFPFRTLGISLERGTVPLSGPGKSGSCRVPGGCASYSDNSAQKWSCGFRIFRGEAMRPSDSWLLQTAGGRGTAFVQLMVLISWSSVTHGEFIRGLSRASQGPGARRNGAGWPGKEIHLPRCARGLEVTGRERTWQAWRSAGQICLRGRACCPAVAVWSPSCLQPPALQGGPPR